MQEQEIFKQYELKSWEFSPRLYKILAASGVVNVLFILGLAQGNILTAKSCDTPIMSSVCSVVDAIYVGSAIMDTDTGYVNEDYVKTELDDADVTFIDLSGQTPPLEYPAGYFAVANPEPVVDNSIVQIPGMSQNNTNPTLGNTYIPGITGNTKTPVYKTPTYKTPTYKNPSTSTDLSKVNPIKPKKNNNAVTGNLDDLDINTDPTVSKDKTNKTNDKDKIKDQTTAQNNGGQKLEDSPVQEKINRKPLEDLGDSLNEKIAKNELDLNKNFIVVMNGTLTKEGRLDKKTSKYVRFEGDEKMVVAAKESIEAIGDSGFLIYLKNQNIDKANLTLAQNDDQIYIQLVSDMKDPNKANTAMSGLNAAIQGAVMLDANGFAKLDESSKLLIKNAKITTDGKNFILTVLIPKAEGQAMISDTLKKRAEKKNKQPNSNSEVSTKTNSETSEK